MAFDVIDPDPKSRKGKSKLPESQDDALKSTILAAVVNGVRQYKRRGGEISDADSLIKQVTASVSCMLADKGMGLADAATRLKFEQLDRDLRIARKSKFNRVS